MIESFRSKALKRYWTRGDEAGIRPDWRKKVRILLSRLDQATEPEHMNAIGFGFHPLTADRVGRWSVVVSRNWRITFSWTGENASEVDLEDYHGD